jgi:hypothetical protein
VPCLMCHGKTSGDEVSGNEYITFCIIRAHNCFFNDDQVDRRDSFWKEKVGLGHDDL